MAWRFFQSRTSSSRLEPLQELAHDPLHLRFLASGEGGVRLGEQSKMANSSSVSCSRTWRSASSSRERASSFSSANRVSIEAAPGVVPVDQLLQLLGVVDAGRVDPDHLVHLGFEGGLEAGGCGVLLPGGEQSVRVSKSISVRSTRPGPSSGR